MSGWKHYVNRVHALSALMCSFFPKHMGIKHSKAEREKGKGEQKQSKSENIFNIYFWNISFHLIIQEQEITTKVSSTMSKGNTHAYTLHIHTHVHPYTYILHTTQTPHHTIHNHECTHPHIHTPGESGINAFNYTQDLNCPWSTTFHENCLPSCFFWLFLWLLFLESSRLQKALNTVTLWV